jgi:YegS/Rv2252/BmrU family lipid kinase
LSRRFALLVNPVSAGGKALKALPAVHTELDRLNAPHRTVTTRSSEHAAAEAAKAAAQGETVAALSGDGMLRPLAAVLKDTEAALAIIPCGRGNDLARVLEIPTDPTEATALAVNGSERLLDVANVDGTPFVGIVPAGRGNDFARHLEIPADAEGACAVLARGRQRTVDIAEVDGQPYVAIASLGIDSEANRIANEAKLVKGNAVYLYAALRALAAWKPAAFTVTIDGERHELSGYSVAVGNSKAYGGGMIVLPDAELDDGKLDVLISTDAPKLTFLRGVFQTFKAAHVDSPHATFLRGEVVEVGSDRPFVIYGDGDPIAATPATVRVERRCLRVVAP